MENKEIILFIIIIINIYLLYKMNKKESFTNSNESITITESIKNLGTIAAEIQKDGNYKFPGNIVIPNGSKIIFEGPDNSGMYTEMYFHNGMNGLEIAQRGGANNLRLYQHGMGIDFGNGTIKTVDRRAIRIDTDLDISLHKRIVFKGDGDKYTEMYYNTGTNGLEIAQRGGADKLRLYQHDNGFDFGNKTIKKVGEGSIKFESPFDDIKVDNIEVSEGKKIKFHPLNDLNSFGQRDALSLKGMASVFGVG